MQGEIALIINTPLGKGVILRRTGHSQGRSAIQHAVRDDHHGRRGLIEAIGTKMSEKRVTVRSLQEIHHGKQIAADRVPIVTQRNPPILTNPQALQ